MTDEDHLRLLRAADAQQVAHRTIHSNSGAGTSRWFVGDAVATAAEALTLHELYADALLMQALGGKVTPTIRGRIQLLLSEQP